MSKILEDRNYQWRIHRRSIEYLQKPNTGIAKTLLIESPAGSGKTIVSMRLAKHLENLRHKIGWIAHRRELLKQAKKCNQDFFNINDIKFISLFTKQPEQYKDRTVVILDEAHHDSTQSASILHEIIKPEIIIGLTATPYRADKAQLCFQKVIRDAGIHQLIREGYLAEFTQWIIDQEWTPENVARTYLQQPSEWGKSVIYFLTTTDALKCEEILKAAGIRAGSVIGTTPEAVREQALIDFRNGALQVLTNVAVLTEGFDCLDMATEVLTEIGWSKYNEIDDMTKIYALNKETGLLELTNIEAYNKRLVRENERLVTFNSQHLDIRVTEGHNFHIKYRDPDNNGKLSQNWLIKTASEMASRRSSYGLPLSAEFNENFTGVPLSDNEIKLIGWFMTDGWLQGKYKSYLCIGQSKEHRILEIRQLLIDLGVDFGERIRDRSQPTYKGFPNAKPYHIFKVPKGTGKGNNKRNGWGHLSKYLDKEVSKELHKMTRKQFHIFWEEAMKGDGAHKGNRAGWLWCEKKVQADTYCHMAIIRGYASSCRPFKTKYNKIIWRVTVRDRKWIISDPKDIRSTRILFDTPKVNEEVWCIKNKLDTLVIRRNGKTAIIGNCPSLKTTFVRPSSRGPTVQMAGRAFRKYPGIPVVNVVQNQDSKYPFTRHARAFNQFIQEQGEWRNIDPKNLEPVFIKQRRKVAGALIELPEFLKKKNKDRFGGFEESVM